MPGIEKTKSIVYEMLTCDGFYTVPLITGGAGIGKTQLVEQLCEDMGLTFSYVNMADRQPGEFAINYVGHDNELRSVVDPVFDADIVFLDELNRSIAMNEIMQIVQTRKVRGVELKCKFIAAMNEGGRFNVESMDEAQRSRFAFIELTPSYEEWSLYMRAKHGSSVDLTNMLNFIQKTGTLSDDSGTVNPRTWDQLITIGLAFSPYLLGAQLSSDLHAFIDAQSYPTYDEASKDNWVPRYAEREYVLGAIGFVSETRMGELITYMSVDSVPNILRDISKLNRELYMNLVLKPGTAFYAYIESI